jgi:dTDP-glucose pyrophosphorylase
MNIIIPIGGKGERFKNLYSQPKPLIKIFNKEMIFYVIDNLILNDDDEIFIIYNKYLDDYHFEDLLKNKYKNIKINLIVLYDQTMGAAQTINLGCQNLKKFRKDRLECTTLICDCDTFYTQNIIDLYRKSNVKNCVFYTENVDPNPIFSYIQLDDEFCITDIAEKIKISDYANTGIYCFENIEILEIYTKKVIKNDIRFRNEYYTSCVIGEMIKDNIKFVGILLDSKFVFNLGTPEQIDAYIEKSKNTEM